MDENKPQKENIIIEYNLDNLGDECRNGYVAQLIVMPVNVALESMVVFFL